MVPLLLKIGSVLADGKGEVIIAGHTDNVPLHGGPYGSNLKLSIARAATVAEFLLAKSAIPASRVSTMGFGKYRPIETNDTDEGRKRNRRVEIILRAPDSSKPRKTEISDAIRGTGPIVKNPVFQ
jgi:chemotaxis protein MotB